MSLFDIIRYPTVDILDSESLHQLPRPLLEAWAAEITRSVEYPFTLYLKNPGVDFSTIAYNTVILSSRKRGATANAQSILTQMYQIQFTKLLMKMLAEYESEI